jgi:hypothetical protein
MKRILSALQGLALAALTLTASGAALAPTTPLFEDGPIVVDAADFEGSMLRIPENRRGEFRMSYDRVVSVVDTLFVTRSVAAKARAAGLDKDPVVQRRMQQLQDSVLADLYMQKLEKEPLNVNLEQRAREVFKAEAASMTRPEEVYTQQILIGLKGRTKEMAAERAKEVREQALKPDTDFLALASKYSEDPKLGENGGDLGYIATASFIEPIRNVVQKMTRKGEVSQPIETAFGYHVVRFIDRHPPRAVKFDEVKEALMKREREKLVKARADAVIEEIRGSKTVIVHPENVEKLVIPLDPEEVKRKAAEAHAAPPATPK